MNNIYKQNIEIDHIQNKQRHKPTRNLKNQKAKIEAPETNEVINEVSMMDDDRKLLGILKSYLLDLLEHSFSPLIEQIFSELTRGSERIEELDKFHFFKISTFMVQICRLRAYEDHRLRKKEAYAQAHQEH